MTPEEFYTNLKKYNIELNTKQKKQFEIYFEELITWNEKINLTAITDKQEVYLKHFYDSISPILEEEIQDTNIKVLDIGAGAGFPSIPMKIIFPKIEITIIDSLNKRITFLNNLSEKLSLNNVYFFHGRAEDYGKDKNFRSQYDIVTARAVARLQVLLEITIPFLKLNGKLVALKASAAEEEISESQNALKVLFSQIKLTKDYHLPNGDKRNITIIEKKKETPNKYPRKAGTPNKKPL